jgi:hypothetical protein
VDIVDVPRRAAYCSRAPPAEAPLRRRLHSPLPSLRIHVMPHRSPRAAAAGASVLVLALASAACTDGPLAPSLAPTPKILAALDCRAEVRSATLSCAPPEETPPGVAASRIVGGQDRFVRLASSGTTYDAGGALFTTTVTVQNLLAAVLGTPDGSTATGVRVFFHEGPTGTGGAVSVQNPDGAAFFTAAEQPYFLYPQMLAPFQISASKAWRFSVAPSTTAFSFRVYVAGEQVDEAAPAQDAVWTGAFSTSWETAANWGGASVPDSTNVVVVPPSAQIPGASHPQLAENARVAHLRVGAGSTLSLGAFDIAVSGNVDAPGTVVGTGRVRMSGASALLRGTLPDLRVDGNVTLQGSTTATQVTVGSGGSLTVSTSHPLTVVAN